MQEPQSFTVRVRYGGDLKRWGLVEFDGATRQMLCLGETSIHF